MYAQGSKGVHSMAKNKTRKEQVRGTMLESLADRFEQEVIRQALAKRSRGEKLTQGDIRVIRKLETRQHGEERQRMLSTLPQKVVCELLQVQPKSLLAWEHLGMPRNADAGKTYSLFAILPWLRHRWESREA